MKIEIELQDNILVRLKEEADNLGISVGELTRYILVNHLIFSHPHIAPPAPTSDPIFPQKQISTLFEFFLKRMLKDTKCSNCMQPLGMESLETGECKNCGEPL